MISHWFARLLFSGRRTAFYEDLAEAVEDNGDPATELETWAGDFPKDPVSGLYRQWAERMRTGRSLPQVLVGSVPAMDLLIISAGQESSSLADGLRTTVMAVNAAQRMQKALLGALKQPAAWLLMIVMLLLLFSFWLAPILKQTGDPASWPVVTQIFYAMAEAIRGYWYLVLLVVGVGGLYLSRSMSRSHGVVRILVMDRFSPPHILYRQYFSAIFLITFTSLLRAGVDIRNALLKIEERATPWLRHYIGRMIEQHDANQANPALALDVGLFNERLMARINNFARRSANFSEALAKVGLGSIDRTIETVIGAAQILNVVLLLFIALFLPGLLIAVGSVVLQSVDGIF